MLRPAGQGKNPSQPEKVPLGRHRRPEDRSGIGWPVLGTPGGQGTQRYPASAVVVVVVQTGRVSGQRSRGAVLSRRSRQQGKGQYRTRRVRTLTCRQASRRTQRAQRVGRVARRHLLLVRIRGAWESWRRTLTHAYLARCLCGRGFRPGARDFLWRRWDDRGACWPGAGSSAGRECPGDTSERGWVHGEPFVAWDYR